MQLVNHNTSLKRAKVVGASPDFDPRWVFHEVEAAVRTDSRAVCDDNLFDILERVARHNDNPCYRLKAHDLLSRWGM